ncbi:hypothetical protein QJS04_geneDACA014319 [Acorus gramineus]|uniref:Glutaredoxin domain-containing protein n=1 Tax=Acorus gramineus TaxID=55184 RepID=A0AAV9A275_ACOGR|nr:hypothetical protein QJS04_geneDACA014319 [Acorus gramineus]
MGCVSSKEVDSAVSACEVYHPSATSFSLFNIDSIDEPWLKNNNSAADLIESEDKPHQHVPFPVLQKLHTLELNPDADPKSWSELRKALQQEDLKKPKPATPPAPKHEVKKPPQKIQRTGGSIHTLEELDRNDIIVTEKQTNSVLVTGLKVKDNPFILRDRIDKEGTAAKPLKWDPLNDFPYKCPPGGADTVVLYTTSLRGVRRTFEDCQKVKTILDGHKSAVDERDVALHNGFLVEMKELFGEEAEVGVPKLFVKGRYLGGCEEVVGLNESGKLRRILKWVGSAGSGSDRPCQGCGGARFVPCLGCNGSCKVLGEDKKSTVRCADCNENGLVLCPICR